MSEQSEISAKPSIIVVDYQGRTAKQRGQRQVEHTYSPFIANLYREGVAELVFHPGANTIDREAFETYKANCADVQQKISKGQIKDITGSLPDVQDLTRGDYDSGKGGLVARTMTQSGLDWIEEQAASIRDKEGRDEVLEMIKLRRPYARPIGFTPEPYRSHRGIDERDASAGRAQA